MKGAALVLLASLGLVAAGCGESSSTGAAGDEKSTIRSLSFALTDAGCDPATAEIPAGPVTFEVENKGASAVTELEVIKGKRILGEIENLSDGFRGDFSLTLQPGSYELYCPNGTTAERGTLTVTGDAVASGDTAAAKKAVAAYRAYVIAQAAILEKKTAAFTAAVREGNTQAAKRLFPTAREPYERIEPVAESFGDLDPEIDARAGDVPAASWTGFHKLEKMLWVDNATTTAMKPVADKLDKDVARLAALVESADYQPAQIANGAKELMDEIGASKVTGEEDRYSHTDLYDFQANVDGARAVYDSLDPLLKQRAPSLTRDDRDRVRQRRTGARALPPRQWLGRVHSSGSLRTPGSLASRRRARRAALEDVGHRRPVSRRLSRRRLLEIAGVGGVAAVAGGGAGAALLGRDNQTDNASLAGAVPYYGAHQAGITTPQQEHLRFASYDLTAADANEVHDLLRVWSDAAARLTAGEYRISAPR